MNSSILAVDDDESALEMIGDVLREVGYEVHAFTSPDSALEFFVSNRTDVVVTDLQMPIMDGIELLRRIKIIAPETPVLLVSAVGTISVAVQAMKCGAFDFLTKPIDVGHLVELIKRALEHRDLMRENTVLRKENLNLRGARIAPIGTSVEMKRLLDKARAVATTEATVLLEGETGTGKEVLADLIQFNSQRRKAPYVKVNCAALSGTLLESELFGHEKGAFTGATERHIGRFEQANKGTIFLDEIGEMSSDAQLRLLRVLQEREMQRVGGSVTISLNIRVICATNKDLKTEILAHRFREDLFYRVNVFPLRIPPLRERKGDIPALCVDLLKGVNLRVGRGPKIISQAVLDRFGVYPWPGNVRELENVLERISIVCTGNVIEIEDLPEELTHQGFANNPIEISMQTAQVQAERERIVSALETCHWNMTNAAKALGIGRSTLYAKLDQFSIEH